MKFFADAPLQTKITWVTMLTALATLVLAVAAISFLEVSQFKRSFVRELRSIAGITGGNSVAALEFLDVVAAERTLTVLHEDPRVSEAALYDSHGQQFAAFAPNEKLRTLPQQVTIEDHETQESDFITVLTPIVYQKQVVGAVLLKATTKQILSQLIEYATVAFCISIGSCLAAYLLSRRLREVISNPILRLAETARKVSLSGNYSLRVVKESNDETGVLVDKFNEMLSQIESATKKLRANEDQLRLITDSLPVSISYIDAKKELKFSNTAHKSLFNDTLEEGGTQRIDEVGGEGLYEVFLPHIQAALAGKTVQFETKISHPNDGERYLSGHYIPDFDSESVVRGFFSLIVDITTRKQADAEREQLLESERMARSEAERASRLKDEFLTTLSHELRTPLNAIVGWSQLLSRGNRNEEQIKEGLGIITRNAYVQTQLIEDLLDLSRIVSGKLVIEKKEVSLPRIIADAVNAVGLTANAKQITIRQHIDSDVVEVSGDSARLQQVVWNLLVNSVKFTPPGGTIDVSLEAVDRATIKVTVRDSGQGISADFLPYVFERFRQADSSTTRQHGGLGIGLSLVKQLVELHGGNVRVESPGIGLGSSFSFTLPLTIAESKKQVEKVAPAEESILLSGIRVLVIDDEPDGCGIVKQILEERGVSVACAYSAKQGFEMFKRHVPQLVVTDIGMPEDDGYAFIGWVRSLSAKEGGTIPVIALTAFAHSEDRRRALLVGFQAHLSKPVNENDLLGLVANLTS